MKWEEKWKGSQVEWKIGGSCNLPYNEVKEYYDVMKNIYEKRD